MYLKKTQIKYEFLILEKKLANFKDYIAIVINIAYFVFLLSNTPTLVKHCIIPKNEFYASTFGDDK